MAILDFLAFTADFTPSNSDAYIVSNSKMNISAINGSQRVSEYPGEGWEVHYRFAVMYPADARKLKALLQKLRGHRNQIKLLDSSYKHTGTWPGTLLVDGAGQYGLALDIKGAPANTTIAYAGDRFRLDQVHELTDDAVTDASGNCTLYLANEIRNPTTNNQAILTDLSALLITCRWADPEQIKQFKGNQRLFRNITLDFLEAR